MIKIYSYIHIHIFIDIPQTIYLKLLLWRFKRITVPLAKNLRIVKRK